MKCVVLFKKEVLGLKRKLRGKIIRCGGERAKRAGEEEKRWVRRCDVSSDARILEACYKNLPNMVNGRDSFFGCKGAASYEFGA